MRHLRAAAPVPSSIRRAVAEELGVAVGPIGLVAAGGAQDVDRQAVAPRLSRAVLDGTLDTIPISSWVHPAAGRVMNAG